MWYELLISCVVFRSITGSGKNRKGIDKTNREKNHEKDFPSQCGHTLLIRLKYVDVIFRLVCFVPVPGWIKKLWKSLRKANKCLFFRAMCVPGQESPSCRNQRAADVNGFLLLSIYYTYNTFQIYPYYLKGPWMLILGPQKNTKIKKLGISKYSLVLCVDFY